MQAGNTRQPSGAPPPQLSSRFPQPQRPTLVTNGDPYNTNSPFNSPQSAQATTPDALNFYKIRQPQPISNGVQEDHAYPRDSEFANAHGHRAASGPVLRKTTSSSSFGQAARSQNASFRDLVARFNNGQETESAAGTMRYARSPSAAGTEHKDSIEELVPASSMAPSTAPQQDFFRPPSRNLLDQKEGGSAERAAPGSQRAYNGATFSNEIILPNSSQQPRTQQQQFVPPDINGSDFDSSAAQWSRPAHSSTNRSANRGQHRRASENIVVQPPSHIPRRSEFEYARVPLASVPSQGFGSASRSPQSMHKRSVSDFTTLPGGGELQRSSRRDFDSPSAMYDFSSGGVSQQHSRSRISARQSPQPHDGSPRAAKRSRSDYIGGFEHIRINRRSITPPGRFYTGRHEISPTGRSSASSGDRVRAIITAPAVKNSPPLRSSRPRQHVSTIRSRSPTPSQSGLNETRTSSQDAATFASTSRERLDANPPEKVNLLTQLSNAVYPRTAPKLTLNVPRLSEGDDQGPLTGLTEFEEDQPLSADMPGSFPENDDFDDEGRSESSLERTRTSPQTQAGQLEDDSTENGGEPETVLDKIMELRHRSSVLLSGVLGSLPANSPTSPTRGASSALRNTMLPRRVTSTTSGAASPVSGSANSSPVMTRSPTRQSNSYVNLDSASSEQSQTLPLREIESGGTIQIMLGNTPTSERSTRPWQTRDKLYRSNTESSLISPRKSLSQSADTPSMSPSTTSPAKGGFLRTPSRVTLDSDSYSVINRVLDQYHETGIVSPEMVQSFQQHILDTDPELAARKDLDSMSIAKAALEDLIRDYSSSSLLGTRSHPNLSASQSQSDDFSSSSPYRSQTSTPKKYEYQPPSVRNMTSAALQNLSPPQTQLYPPQKAEDRDMPQHTFASGFRPRHYATDKSQASTEVQVTSGQAEEIREDDSGPTPPPKDNKYSNFAQIERPNAVERRPLNYRIPPRQSSSGSNRRPVLPEIVSTGGGLGLFNTPRASHESGSSMLSYSSHPPNKPTQNFGTNAPLPPVPGPVPGPVPASVLTPAHAPALQQPMIAPPLSNTDSSRTLQGQPASESLQNGDTTPASSVAKPTSIQSADSPALSASIERTSSSIGGDNTPTAEQRRLIKRRHLIKELVDTEFSFNQDMKVIEDIYKGTASAVEALTPDDRRILFGNSAQIVEFSESFLDTLKQASASVYVMPRTNKWRIKRGSMSKAPSTHEDHASVGSTEGTDDERDRRTYLGEAFGQHIPRMEKVYGDYLRNHDLANQRLAKLQNVPQVNLWLNECHTYASDITSAWDLDSLLVKPVQRILKYPLLLKSLLEATTSDHPDYAALEIAVKQMMDVSHRINESKKRAELLEQVVKRPTKRKEYDVGVALSKAFGRRNEKMKQQVGLSDAVEDPEYKAISEKFGGQFFQLQVVMRDMENYKKSTEEFVKQWNRLVEGMEEMLDVGHHNDPEMEAKWRRLTLTIREMTAIAYMDHEASVRRYCVDPMATLLRLHEGPQKLMTKRKKHIVEYATYLTRKNRGERLDKKTQEQGEQFIALNETLKDELPKLFSLTAKLVQACLRNYVDIQVQWHSTWQRKIKAMVRDAQIPKDLADVVETFSAEHALAEAQMQALNLLNGNQKFDTVSLMSSAAPTLVGTEESSLTKRPSALTTTNSTTSVPDIVHPNLSPTLPHHMDNLRRRSNASGHFAFNSPRTSMDVNPNLNRHSHTSGTNTPYPTTGTSPQRAGANRLRANSSANGSKLGVAGLGASTTPPMPPNRVSAGQTIAYGPYNERPAPATRPTTATSSRSPTLATFATAATGNIRNAAAIAARLSASSAKSVNSSNPNAGSSNMQHSLARTSNSTLYSMPSSIGGLPVYGRQRSAPTSPELPSTQFSQGKMAHAPAPGTALTHGLRDMRHVDEATRYEVEYDDDSGYERSQEGGQARPGQSEDDGGEGGGGYRILFLAASLFEFNIDRSRKEAGYPYLTYVPGEVFDVIGEKGELWLARNQDDNEGLVGWIWEKHFAKLMPDKGEMA